MGSESPERERERGTIGTGRSIIIFIVRSHFGPGPNNVGGAPEKRLGGSGHLRDQEESAAEFA